MINRSREVWFVVSGSDKAAAAKMALLGAGPVQVPAGGVAGPDRTLWLLDREPPRNCRRTWPPARALLIAAARADRARNPQTQPRALSPTCASWREVGARRANMGRPGSSSRPGPATDGARKATEASLSR